MPKMSRFVGANTLFRRRTTNEQTASNFTNMVFDHSSQKSIIPDRYPKALIECTQGLGPGPTRPMNASGRPKALNVDIGGSPDDPGTRK